MDRWKVEFYDICQRKSLETHRNQTDVQRRRLQREWEKGKHPGTDFRYEKEPNLKIIK